MDFYLHLSKQKSYVALSPPSHTALRGAGAGGWGWWLLPLGMHAQEPHMQHCPPSPFYSCWLPVSQEEYESEPLQQKAQKKRELRMYC